MKRSKQPIATSAGLACALGVLLSTAISLEAARCADDLSAPSRVDGLRLAQAAAPQPGPGGTQAAPMQLRQIAFTDEQLKAIAKDATPETTHYMRIELELQLAGGALTAEPYWTSVEPLMLVEPQDEPLLARLEQAAQEPDIGQKVEAAVGRTIWVVPLERFTESRVPSAIGWKDDGTPRSGLYAAAKSFRAKEAPEKLTVKLFGGLPPALLSNRPLVASNFRWTRVRSTSGNKPFEVSALRLRATLDLEAMNWPVRTKVLLLSAMRDIWLAGNRVSDTINIASAPYFDVDSKSLISSSDAALINAAVQDGMKTFTTQFPKYAINGHPVSLPKPNICSDWKPSVASWAYPAWQCWDRYCSGSLSHSRTSIGRDSTVYSGIPTFHAPTRSTRSSTN